MSPRDTHRPTTTVRFGVSLPTAIGLALFAGAVVFGSSMFTPAGDGAGHDGSAYTEPTDHAKPTATESTDADGTTDGDAHDTWTEDGQEPPHGQPDATPKTEPTAEPKPSQKPVEPTPTSKPKAEPGTLALEIGTVEGWVKLGWSAYQGDGFSYYKVVRSADATVTWPPSGDDQLVAAIGNQAETWTKDAPPCATEWHYRVFAVRKTDAGYQVLAASAVKGAAVDCMPSPPPPVTLAFEAGYVEGSVHLSWQKCGSDHFAVYKIVRSQTNPEPMYPLNDGTELIAAIGDQSVTGFADGAVSSGQTWHYRVLCLGSGADGWYLIGLSAAVTVAIP